MSRTLLTLADIPAEGRDFSFDDPAIWSGPANELGMEIKVLQPLIAEAKVERQPEGCSVHGTLTGKVSLVCNRCTDPAIVEVDERFHEFEELPREGEEDSESRIALTDRGFVLDISAILWEQLMLALPVKPLCREDCKGLCPVCGLNLNEASCDCAKEEHDPRMEVLRQIKIS